MIEGTCYDGRNAPSNDVVEPHVPEVDVPHFSQHPVDVELLHEHPCEGAHVEIMQEDGNHGTHKLQKGRAGKLEILNHNLMSHQLPRAANGKYNKEVSAEQIYCH